MFPILNMYNATFVTYNCKNVKRSTEGIRQICGYADIIALQETWLFPHDLPYLSSLHEEFGSTGTSAVDTSKGILKGRPNGGVALLWRKAVFKCVSVVPCSNPRIAAIRVATNDRPVLVVSVYMPTDSSENLLEFTDCLSTVNAIIDEVNVESVFILGDFNAHPRERFYYELTVFSAEQDWICVDVEKLGVTSETYTFISEANGSRRWLDHCVSTRAARLCVTDVHVEYGVYWSDHFPLVVKCNLDVVRQKTETMGLIYNKATWGIRGEKQIKVYRDICNSKLKNVDFPCEFQECANSYCCNELHKNVIDNLYMTIVDTMSQAASVTCEDRKPKRRRNLAGWNKHVADAHRIAKQKFNTWVLFGKPTGGQIVSDMKESRKFFKSKLRWCLNHQEQIIMDLMAKHHHNKDFPNFWKTTNKTSAKPGIPVSVDGFSSPTDIANMFRDYFSVKSPLGPPGRVVGAGTHGPAISTVITAKDVRLAINKMTRGKSPGRDGLSIEHLRHAGVHLPRVLAMFYSLCINHSYLPPGMVETLVVPILKNKTGDVSDRSNYRPISLATIVAKVLDSVLNSILSQHVKLSDAQFGFRPGLSTEMAILSLKHTVRYYTDRSTPVYACFLDLSKAFDLVSYDLLWDKMLNTGLPPEVVHLFRYWYLNQVNRVRWGGGAFGAMQAGVRSKTGWLELALNLQPVCE